MGGCESKAEREGRVCQRLDSASRALVPGMVRREAAAPDGFFAAYLYAVTRLLPACEDGAVAPALDFAANVVAEDRDVADLWRVFAKRQGSVKPSKQRGEMIRAWLQFDKDFSGDLSLQETQSLVHSLNYPVEITRSLKQKVRDFPSSTITFHEFESLLAAFLEWPELLPYWTAACEGINVGAPGSSAAPRSGTAIDELVLPESNLKLFLEVVQHEEDVTDAEVTTLSAQISTGGRVTQAAFLRYLTSPELNSVFVERYMQTVYMDMSLDMTCYYVNSSHNTYLSGDQLASQSKPEMYAIALRDGCRCVELDCWDGKDGRPVIYHGFTRTSKIQFEDAIRAIAANAFVASEYPVILSLELHTTVPQQRIMAEVMERHFGPRLAIPTWQPGEEASYSPEQYKGMIVVKGKRGKPKQHHTEEGGGTRPPGEDIPHAASSTSLLTLESDSDEDLDKAPEVLLAKKEAEEAQQLNDDNGTGNGPRAGASAPVAAPEPKGHGAKIAPELSRIIVMEGKKLSKVLRDNIAKAKPYECVSINENKSHEFVKRHFKEYVAHNQHRFTRVYPAGHRVNSSNYHPQPHWNAGSQIVALNWQTTRSYELRLNKGRFRDNGNSGYILKPEYLLSGDGEVPPTGGVRIDIEVICGYALPKPEGAVSGEVVDPYVTVFLEGPDVDPNEKYHTQVVDDNGYHPVWRGDKKSFMSFTAPSPQLTTLVLQVHDHDVDADDFLGECFVPLHAMRTGVRCFPLRDADAKELPTSVILASVAVHAAA